jgi:putative endonuclease
MCASFFMYTVYILYSPSYKKHYVGFTSNLEARMISHNERGAGWTSRYRPWEILYTETSAEKKEALLRERWFKTGAGRDFIRNLHK